MDQDLEKLSRDELIEEVKKLRAGIREHRDSSGHALCWHHPQLWGLLPEKVSPALEVPEWPQFLRGCLKYRESLDAQLPDAPRTTGEFAGESPKP
ncbi:MAG: hypothetical protein K0R17_634 [Rariglobus sp.]|jgi:hypothetical protein|nr:hypothetical protein [Rariglobus sp.]